MHWATLVVLFFSCSYRRTQHIDDTNVYEWLPGCCYVVVRVHLVVARCLFVSLGNLAKFNTFRFKWLSTKRVGKHPSEPQDDLIT